MVLATLSVLLVRYKRKVKDVTNNTLTLAKFITKLTSSLAYSITDIHLNPFILLPADL